MDWQVNYLPQLKLKLLFDEIIKAKLEFRLVRGAKSKSFTFPLFQGSSNLFCYYSSLFSFRRGLEVGKPI